MIVDCHSHLFRYPGEISEELKAETERMRSKPLEMNCTPDMLREGTRGANVVITFGLRAARVGFTTDNRWVAECVRAEPDRLIGFAALDPTDADCREQFEECVESLGFQGLKLAPIYSGWHVSDPRAAFLFEECEKRGLPILFHQGATFPRLAPLKYGKPMDLEDIAIAHPGLRMIIAHMGHPWYEEACVLVRKHQHLFMDISGLFYRPWQFYNALRCAVEYGVADRLLFGSDYPVASFQETLDGLRDVVRQSASWGVPPLPPSLPEEILNRDTLGLLGLKAPA